MFKRYPLSIFKINNKTAVIMKKIIPAVIICILIPIYIFSAQNNKIRIIVFNLDVKSGIETNQVSILNDTIRTELINSGTFEVISHDQIPKNIDEMKFQSLGFTSETDAIQLGQMLNATKSIIGSIGKYGDNTIVNLYLYDMVTGKLISGEKIVAKTPEGILSQLEGTVKILSRKAEIQVIKMELSDIETLISKKDYENARNNLNIYVEQSGNSPETTELSNKIDSSEALDNYTSAKNMVKADRLDNAETNINRAIALEPDNKEYEKLAGDIRDMKNSRIYWLDREKHMKYGGLDIFGTYFLYDNNFIREHYPNLIAPGIGIQFPIGKYVTIYNRVSYTGLNGKMQNLPSSLTDASIWAINYKGGLKLHYLFFTILDIYAQAGAGYLYFNEFANDGKNSATLTFDNLGYEYGGGLKAMITTSFGIYAECMFNFNTLGVNKTDFNSRQIDFGICLGI